MSAATTINPIKDFAAAIPDGATDLEEFWTEASYTPFLERSNGLAYDLRRLVFCKHLVWIIDRG